MADEIDRVRRVYEDYAKDPDTAHRWDATRPGNRAMAAERAGTVDRVLRRNAALPETGWILDVGCGNGSVLAAFAATGARLAGIDLSPDRARIAKPTVPGGRVLVADGGAIPFGDEGFDLVLAFTVFSSILDDGLAHRIAAEMWRVTRPGGSVLVYDFRYRSRNVNTRPVNASMISRLFGATVTDGTTLTLLPPLSRALGPLARWLYRPLAAVPFMRSHELILIRKP